MSVVDIITDHWRGLGIAAGAGLVGGGVLDGARGAGIGLLVAPAFYIVGILGERELKSNGQIRVQSLYVTPGEATNAQAQLTALVNSTKYMIDVGVGQDDSRIATGPGPGAAVQLDATVIGNYKRMLDDNSPQAIVNVLTGARLNQMAQLYQMNQPTATLSKRT